MYVRKLSLVFLSPIYPIYDPKTPKDSEFHKEFESDVENTIALRKHTVFKEILFSLEIYPIYDPKTPKDAEFHEQFESDAENAIALQKQTVLKEIRVFVLFR